MNSSDRNRLRKAAHVLKPVVMLGQNGLSDSVLAAVNQALDSHELVKIKFQDMKTEKPQIAKTLTEKTGAAEVAIIGNILILYLPAQDPALRKYGVVL